MMIERVVRLVMLIMPLPSNPLAETEEEGSKTPDPNLVHLIISQGLSHLTIEANSKKSV